MLNCIATFGELRPDDPVQGEVGGPGVGERRALRLPGAHGRRRARLRHRAGPRGRRPAPAPRARPRHRHPVQPPLRRHARGARGEHPAGRCARHGPAAPHEQDVEVGRLAPGHDPAARRPEVDHQAHQERGHRLRQRGPLRPRRASPACRTCCRSSASVTDRTAEDVEAEFAGRGTARSRARSPTRSWSSCARCRSGTRSSRPIPAEVARILAVGADRAEAIAATVMARVRDAVGLLPRRQLMADELDDDARDRSTGPTPVPPAVRGARVRPGRVLQRRGVRDRDDAARGRHRHPRRAGATSRDSSTRSERQEHRDLQLLPQLRRARVLLAARTTVLLAPRGRRRAASCSSTSCTSPPSRSCPSRPRCVGSTATTSPW